MKTLDNALQEFHVQRQAYYSGTFVGNHCHSALKVCVVLLEPSLIALGVEESLVMHTECTHTLLCSPKLTVHDKNINTPLLT